MKVKVIIDRFQGRLRQGVAAHRKAAYRAHRVLGVGLALWLALLALTGALLVFRAELDWLSTPALRVEPAAASEPAWRPERVTAAVDAHAPGARLLRVDRPATSRSASLVRIAEGAHTRELFVHPRTGAVLGGRSLDDGQHSLADLVRQLHVRVLLGAWGRTLVGLLGLLWVAALVTGWWVHGRRRPSRTWRARLHAGLARVTLPYAVMMGVSGAWLGLETLPYLLSRVDLRAAFGAPHEAPHDAPHEAPHEAPVPETQAHGDVLAHAEEHANRALPGARVQTLWPPEHPDQAWLAGLEHTSAWLPPGAVELDLPRAAQPGQSGQPARPARLYAPTTAEHVTGALEALHVGSFAQHAGPFAWPLRLLWALLGATPVVVALAGLYGTLRRYRARAKQRPPLPLTPRPLRELT